MLHREKMPGVGSFEEKTTTSQTRKSRDEEIAKGRHVENRVSPPWKGRRHHHAYRQEDQPGKEKRTREEEESQRAFWLNCIVRV